MHASLVLYTRSYMPENNRILPYSILLDYCIRIYPTNALEYLSADCLGDVIEATPPLVLTPVTIL